MAKSAMRPLLLLLAYVVAGGCAPPLGLDNRPCPCGSGFTCCESSNVCIRAGDSCGGGAVPNAPMAWVHTPMVRQGETVLVTLIGSDGTAPTTNRNFAVAASRVPSSWDVIVPHGAPLGDVDVRFTTKTGASAAVKALFVVSEITVSPMGSDLAHGTRADPFHTYTRAAAVAGKGDIIQLLNNPDGYSVSTGEAPVTSLPRDVTLRGESASETLLMTVLKFDGDATVKNLTLTARAHVTEPASVVKFDNVIALAGLSLDASAGRARVDLTGRSTLSSADFPTLLVQAPDVTIKISGETSIDKTGGNGAEAVRLEGRHPTVYISAVNMSSTGMNALVDRGGGTFMVQSLVVSGMLNLADPESTASISSSTFQMSATKGSAGAGIAFGGRSLTVLGSTFFGMGITQDSPDGAAVVHDCNFTEFPEPAYVLWAGSLDLGNKDEPGNNMFMGRPSREGVLAPALSIVAKPGRGWATSRATSFNGQVPTPSAVMGPASTREYEISDKVPINFY
jgi:hypothetical protein